MEIVVLFLLVGVLLPTEGLKCIRCTHSPGISGNNEDCNVEGAMKKYLTGCEYLYKPPFGIPVSTSVNESQEKSSLNDFPSKQMYCYTFAARLNGKWLIERGCGLSRVSINLHDTCENITKKNSTAVNLSNAKMCYCSDEDGCNSEVGEEFKTEPSPEDIFPEHVHDNNDRSGQDATIRDRSDISENKSVITKSSSIFHPRMHSPPNYENPFDKLHNKNGRHIDIDRTPDFSTTQQPQSSTDVIKKDGGETISNTPSKELSNSDVINTNSPNINKKIKLEIDENISPVSKSDSPLLNQDTTISSKNSMSNKDSSVEIFVEITENELPKLPSETQDPPSGNTSGDQRLAAYLAYPLIFTLVSIFVM